MDSDFGSWYHAAMMALACGLVAPICLERVSSNIAGQLISQ
jgi:hypothetical protein